MTTTLEEKLKEVQPEQYKTPPDIFAKIGAEPVSQISKWLKILIYGEPGAGKTFFIGTASDSFKTEPAVVADVDGGLMTIANKQNVRGFQVRSIKELSSRFDDIHSAIDTSSDTLPFKV